MAVQGLTPPRNPRIAADEQIRLTWDTSYAGNEPITNYEIIKDARVLEKVHTSRKFDSISHLNVRLLNRPDNSVLYP